MVSILDKINDISLKEFTNNIKKYYNYFGDSSSDEYKLSVSLPNNIKLELYITKFENIEEPHISLINIYNNKSYVFGIFNRDVLVKTITNINNNDFKHIINLFNIYLEMEKQEKLSEKRIEIMRDIDYLNKNIF